MKKPLPNKPIIIDNINRYISQSNFWHILRLIPAKRRKYAVIYAIMRFMGRRPCEVCPMHIDDIDFTSQEISFLIGKTNILTKQSVPDDVWAMLTSYINKNKHTFVNGYIFPAMTSSQEHISPDTASRYFRDLADDIGMNQKITKNGRVTRINRFYDLVGSCATDVTNEADTKQAMIVRRHTDERAIKHYQHVREISREKNILNRICKMPHNRLSDFISAKSAGVTKCESHASGDRSQLQNSEQIDFLGHTENLIKLFPIKP